MPHLHHALACLAMVGPAAAHVFLNWREAWPVAFATAIRQQAAWEAAHHAAVRPDQRAIAVVHRIHLILRRRGHLLGKEAIRGEIRRISAGQPAR